MIRPLFILILAAIVAYVIVRFRYIDERLVIMRRSLDTRITDADVQSIMAMVREHIGGELQTRIETLEERMEVVEESIDLGKLPRATFDILESASTEEALAGPTSDESDDEEAPPSASDGAGSGSGSDAAGA